MGLVQRRIIAVLESKAKPLFTVQELAKFCYPDEPVIARTHEEAVRRALRTMPKEYQIYRQQRGEAKKPSWHLAVALR
jgi:hypothetical protein